MDVPRRVGILAKFISFSWGLFESYKKKKIADESGWSFACLNIASENKSFTQWVRSV
jgi:hypothetical protein